jgi:hypothetical protein
MGIDEFVVGLPGTPSEWRVEPDRQFYLYITSVRSTYFCPLRTTAPSCQI